MIDSQSLASRGFTVAALLDADERRVGERIAGLAVRSADELEQVVREEHVHIAVLATPAESAQGVCDRLVAAGVTSVLNFAPCVLDVPDHVMVRKVDLSTELQILAFHEQRRVATHLAVTAVGVEELPDVDGLPDVDELRAVDELRDVDELADVAALGVGPRRTGDGSEVVR